MVTRQVMSPRKEIPSVVDMAVDWLKDTGICGNRVSSSLPVSENERVWPWLTVGRVVGVTVTAEAPLDRARLQFNAYGGTKANGAPDWGPADEVIRALEQEVRTTLSVTVPGKGYLRGIQGLEGIQQLEDPDTGGARFWMDAIVVGYPT